MPRERALCSGGNRRQQSTRAVSIRRNGRRTPSVPAWRQRGQAIVLGMFLMLVASASVIVLYNTAQAATEKTRLVNAADSAAYSGAIWTARQLNFMAYTNRAMITNHVMAGHLVSYVSWLRYVEATTDNIQEVTGVLSTVTAPVPYLGAILRAIDQGAELLHEVAETLEDITEPVASGFLTGVDALNRVLSIGQGMAWTNMQAPVGSDQISSPLHQVMSETATYHTETGGIRVNHPEDLASLTGAISAVNITQDFSKLLSFSKSYFPYESDTKDRMRFMVNESMGPSEPWINDRKWSVNWFVVRFKKTASTTHDLPAYSGDGGEWSAADELEYKTPLDLKWHTVGKDKAKATESDLYPGYKGIPGYRDMNKLNPDSDDRNLNLKITAYATMPMAESRLKDLLGMGGAPQKMAAVSRAQVTHRRPPNASGLLGRQLGGFGDWGNSRNNEYANVYNPFWGATLTKVPTLF